MSSYLTRLINNREDKDVLSSYENALSKFDEKTKEFREIVDPIKGRLSCFWYEYKKGPEDEKGEVFDSFRQINNRFDHPFDTLLDAMRFYNELNSLLLSVKRGEEDVPNPSKWEEHRNTMVEIQKRFTREKSRCQSIKKSLHELESALQEKKHPE